LIYLKTIDFIATGSLRATTSKTKRQKDKKDKKTKKTKNTSKRNEKARHVKQE
jgi:hypothetical protein